MSGAAESVGLDGTLRAVVAADRLAFSEAEDEHALVRRRLTVFYAYFAVFGLCGALLGRWRRFPVDVDPRQLSLLLEAQVAHTLVLGATLLVLRWKASGPRLVRALDIVATLATSVMATVTLSIVPYAVTVDLSAVSFFLLFFTLRAALVPSKPWLATLIAALCAVPFLLGFWNLYRASALPDPVGASLGALRALIAGIAAVYLVTKTIHGLRRVVQQAVQLGQYVVHEKIGEGGMGAVYRASHAMLKRPTAIKLIAPDRASDTASARFEREVMAASRLSHPNNVAIYDFGRTRGGVFYYAMELLDGQDLSRLVKAEGPQSVARTLHILRQIAAALSEAHAAGLVHRDVKPENVMLCTRGGVPDFVKVLDFGLVKNLVAPEATQITAESALAGTPLYMPPETILHPASVGPAADVYALGCLACFLLTGRPPFPGKTIVEVCFAHVQTNPEPPSRHAPSPIPADLDALILRCLDKDAQQRPTMRELGEQLGATGGASFR